jgi:hypothetical protein
MVISTLTNKTDSDHLILFNEFLDVVFPGLAWRTGASQDWKDQISDTGSNPYSVSINGDFKLILPARERRRRKRDGDEEHAAGARRHSAPTAAT